MGCFFHRKAIGVQTWKDIRVLTSQGCYIIPKIISKNQNENGMQLPQKDPKGTDVE